MNKEEIIEKTKKVKHPIGEMEAQLHMGICILFPSILFSKTPLACFNWSNTSWLSFYNNVSFIYSKCYRSDVIWIKK